MMLGSIGAMRSGSQSAAPFIPEVLYGLRSGLLSGQPSQICVACETFINFLFRLRLPYKTFRRGNKVRYLRMSKRGGILLPIQTDMQVMTYDYILNI